eukprot:2929408-Amphidinium_carterae.2
MQLLQQEQYTKSRRQVKATTNRTCKQTPCNSCSASMNVLIARPYNKPFPLLTRTPSKNFFTRDYVNTNLLT